jgi:DNA polymerase I-like protein with 3'-5' exonuclease and polymerase domains
MAQALRFAGHLTGAAEAAQAYWDNPLLDNHDFMAQLTGLKRSHAKIVYLGLCYGEGGAKLCHDLGLPTAYAVHFAGKGVKVFSTQDEAMEAAHASGVKTRWYECAGPEGQKILDTFDQRAPFIRQLANVCKYLVELRGWIRTAGGRLLHFPQNKDGSFDWSHKALNRLIQGTSADQNKEAMVALDNEMPELFMQLPVHDELDGSFETVTQGKKAKVIMMECMGKTKVPFRVDDEYGPNWGYIAEAA